MEKPLIDVINLFNQTAAKMETLKDGCVPSFSISVDRSKYSDPTTTLSCHFYDGKNYSTVQAASLSALTDEVMRRLGFADREALEIDRVNNSLKALPNA